MEFEYHSFAFVLLSICRYVLPNENLSTNNEDMTNGKCSGDSWPSNPECSKLSSVHLPYCYCDEACYEYRDCCYDVNIINVSSEHETSRSSNEADQQFRSMICLGNPVNEAGFWIVNSCRSTDKIYSDITSFALNPPVTDSNNVTYFNADCARCNNVTVFKTWDILITETFTSFNFVNTSFTESVLENNIKDMLPRLGEVKLIPPSGILIRVCYGEIEDYNNCTTNQYPVFGNHRLFKDEECCRNAGSDKCILAWKRKDWCNYIPIIKFRDGHILNSSYNANVTTGLMTGGDKVFAILLQFHKYNKRDSFAQECVTDEKQLFGNENCHNMEVDSLRQNLLISGYPMKYTLILVSYESIDKDWSILMLRSIATFLLDTKWKISFKEEALTYVCLANDQGSHCSKSIYQISRMYPRKMLTLTETILLEAWMDALKIDIYIQSPVASFNASGSFSIQTSFSERCGLKDESILQEFDLFNNEIKLLPTASSKIPNHCEKMALSVIYYENEEELKISCRMNNMENKSVNQNKHRLSILSLILYAMLSCSLFV